MSFLGNLEKLLVTPGVTAAPALSSFVGNLLSSQLTPSVNPMSATPPGAPAQQPPSPIADRLYKIGTGAVQSAEAPVGLVMDLATSPFKPNMLDNIVNSGRQRLGQAFGQGSGLEASVGALPGGLRTAIKQPTMAGLGWVDQNIEKPWSHALATPFMASNLAEHQSNSFTAMLDGDTWAKAWGLTKNLSPGQVIASSLNFGPGPTDPNAIQQETSHGTGRLISGSIDFAKDWYLDPLVIGGKAAKIAKITKLDRPVGEIGKTFQEQAQAYTNSNRYEKMYTAAANASSATELWQKAFRGNTEAGPLATTLFDAAKAGDKEQFRLSVLSAMGDNSALADLGRQAPQVADQIASLRAVSRRLAASRDLNAAAGIDNTAGSPMLFPASDVAGVPESLLGPKWQNSGYLVWNSDPVFAGIKDAAVDAQARADWITKATEAGQNVRGALIGLPEPRIRMGANLAYHIRQTSIYHAPVVSMLWKHSPRIIDYNRSSSTVAEQVGQWLDSGTSLSHEDQEKLLDPILRATTAGERQAAVQAAEQAGYRSLAVDHGLTVEQANKILQDAYATGGGKQLAEDALRNNRRYDGSDRDLAWVSARDEDGVTHRMPIMVSQNANAGLLVDLHKAASIFKANSGLIKGALQHAGDLGEHGLDIFYQVWKPMALLRLGWPLRVVADEQLRILAKIGAMSYVGMAQEGIRNKLRNAANRELYRNGKLMERAQDAIAAKRPVNIPPADVLTDGTTPTALDGELLNGNLSASQYAQQVEKMAAEGNAPLAEQALHDAYTSGHIPRMEMHREFVDMALWRNRANDYQYAQNLDALAQQLGKGKGFTYRITDGRQVKDYRQPGYVVNPYRTSQTFTSPGIDDLNAFIEKNKELLLKPGHYLSGHVEPNGQTRLDVVAILNDRNKAISLANKKRLASVHDLQAGSDIPVTPEGIPAPPIRKMGFGSTRYKGVDMPGIFGDDVTNPNALYDMSGSRGTWEALGGRHEQRLLNEMRTKTAGYKSLHPGDKGYEDAWMHDANVQLPSDLVARQMLEGRSDQKILNWLKKPQGKQYSKEIPWRAHFPEKMIENIRGQVENYLPTDNLKAAALKGEANIDLLKKELANPNAWPSVHGGNLLEVLGKGPITLAVNRVVNKLYHWLGSLPTDTLSRHPFANQQYQAAMKRRIDALVENAQREGRTVTDDEVKFASDKAREFALDQSRRLLYDITNQTDMAHLLRYISPFWQAWQETLGVWGKLVWHNPELVPRAFQVWTSPERAGLITDADGNKVNWDQPAQGGRYITIPVPAPIKKWMEREFGSGPIRVNKASGNISLQGSPGVGPPVSIPLAALVANKPDLGDRLKWALPYGPQAADQLMLPAAYQRLKSLYVGRYGNPQDDRDFYSAYMNILTAETVDYKLGKRKTLPSAAEVKWKAQKYFMLRFMSNVLSPMAPSFGSPYQVQIDALRKLKQADPTTADQKFLDQYGPEFFDLTRGVSKAMGGVSPTLQGYKAYNKYKDLIAQYPDLGSFIIGKEGAGSFNRSVYEWQFGQSVTPGSSQKLRSYPDPQVAITDPERRLGWLYYSKAMDIIDGERIKRGLPNLNVKAAADLLALKRQATAVLLKRFPEWAKDYQQIDTGAMSRRIAGFTALAQDKRMQGRPDVQGLTMYLAARKIVMDELQARKAAGKSSTLTSRSNADLYNLWQTAVGKIIERNLAFADTYHRYLEHDALAA